MPDVASSLQTTQAIASITDTPIIESQKDIRLTPSPWRRWVRALWSETSTAKGLWSHLCMAFARWRAGEAPPALVGNELTPAREHLIFYHELGLAITQWAQVEHSLGALVADCVNDWAERQILFDGFYSIENFRSKLSFCSAVLRRKHGPSLNGWQHLFDRAERAARSRNKLAHHQVRIYTGGSAGRRYALIPWPRAEEHTDGKPPDGAVCVRDINGMRLEFSSLRFALDNFASCLRGQPEFYEKRLEKPMATLTLNHMLRDVQMLAGVEKERRG